MVTQRSTVRSEPIADLATGGEVAASSISFESETSQLVRARLARLSENVAIDREREAAAEQRTTELELANQALRKGIAGLGQLNDLSLFLEEMLKVAVATSGAHSGGVVLLDEAAKTYCVYPLLRANGEFEPRNSSLTSALPLSPGVEAIFQDVNASTAWIMSETDRRMDPEFVDYHRAEGNLMVAHIPMRVGDRLVGMLGLGFPTRDTQFEKEFSLLRSLADQMCLAVEIMRLSEEAKLAAVAREREQAAESRTAELSRINEQLALRDRLLTASAQALERLISAENFDSGVADALRKIGEAAGLSRVQVLMETTMETGEPAHELIHEWWSPDLKSQNTLGYLLFPNADFQETIDLLYQGDRWWARTEDWPSRIQPTLRQLGIVWTGVVPIFVQQQYVGLVAFDQCNTGQDWSDAEIDALTIAAKGIGAALSQERMAAQLVSEREQAAQDRASELVKANNALRASVDDLVTQTTSDGILTSLLKQAVDISGASSGAILKWIVGTEFEYVTIYTDGVIRTSGEILAAGTNTEMRLASRLDPTGCFSRLATGEAQWREIDDEVLSHHLPRSTSFHKTAGNKRIYNFPYKVAGQVFGYLGLAFADQVPPSETVQETIKALANQVGLALEFRRISEQVERAAVIEERNKFARDLHDTLAQGFAAIIMQLGAAEQVASMPSALQPYLTRIEDLARSNLAEARRTVSELRTSERVRDPFLNRIAELARQAESVCGIIVQLQVTGGQHALPPVVEDELFLIAQESLTNVIKHAQAIAVGIDLTFTHLGVRLKIKDDGRGFSCKEQRKPDHFGLQTMQERSQRIRASLTIISEPGFGTEILTVWNDPNLE